MSTFLPLFPLQLVVYPAEKLKLHIFEPRYKQLIGECHDTNNPFGIPVYLDGKIAEYGTEVRLLRIMNTYPNGELDILTEGVRAFRLERYEKTVIDKMYSGGYVAPVENVPDAYPVTVEELARQYARFHELLKTGYSRDRFDHRNVSFQVAQEVGLMLPQKVHLLSLPRETDRQLYIIQHLHEVIPVLEGAEDTKRRVKGNGHFKNLPPIKL
jgi:hypothetical protein